MNKNIFKEKYKKKYGYRLTGGDTIKFGRVRFVVKVISDSDYEAKPTLIMKEEQEEEEKNEPGDAQRDKTFEEFDKFNENENFQDGGFSQRNRVEDEASMNKLKKSLKILQTIPKQSYESSLFFEMMSKPVEDFMSERSSEADEKYKDDEVVVDLIEKLPTEDKVCRICLGNETEDENCEENPLFAP